MKRSHRSIATALAALGLFVQAPQAASSGSGPTTLRVSVATGGAQATGGQSWAPALSADGRFVAFTSDAPNLTAGDANGLADVFLHDTLTGTTVRAAPAGVDPDGYSEASSLSADGRFVVYSSPASNLVPGDTNGVQDIFLFDRVTGAMARVSVSSGGGEGDLSSGSGSISADGRFVAFTSAATNLVAGDTNGVTDVFLRDLRTGVTERVSVGVSGQEADDWSATFMGFRAVSAGGDRVVFNSRATNLVSGDTGATDVFVRDRRSGTTLKLSSAFGGGLANGHSMFATISDDGETVAFTSSSSDLDPRDNNVVEDMFVHELTSGSTRLVSLRFDGSASAGGTLGVIAPTGDFVSFLSGSDALVPGHATGFAEIFLRDLRRESTSVASLAADGAPGNSHAWWWSSVSAHGRHVGFSSRATNLVPGDTNGQQDVFVRDTGPLVPVTYCEAKTNSAGCTPAIGSSGLPSASLGSGFTISASEVLNQTGGLLFYGVSGRSAAPFQGGFLCVRPPLRRTAAQGSGGNPPPPSDCSGSFAFDFNAWIASGVDPALQGGQFVWAQYYSRDPGFPPPDNVGLTDALEFRIEP